MQYGMYVSAAGALANSYRQDVIANNLANVETVSFKRDLALLQARQTESAASGRHRNTTAMLEGIGGGTFALPVHTDYSPAGLERTGGDYDLGLDGVGFFMVSDKSGVQYTRDGRFMTDTSNRLVTVEGELPLLDVDGKEIKINPDASDFVVSANGMISQDGNILGRIAVVDFADKSLLHKSGSGLYTSDNNGAHEFIDAVVRQGFLESSGVDSISELVNMMRAQRSFQLNASMLQLQDQTLGMAVSKLGSIS